TLRELADHRDCAGRRRTEVVAAADGKNGHIRVRARPKRRVAGRRGPLLAEVRRAEAGGPLSDRAECAWCKPGDSRVDSGLPRGRIRAGRPRETTVGAVRRGVEAEAQILRRELTGAEVEVVDPQERPHVALEGGVHRGGSL